MITSRRCRSVLSLRTCWVLGVGVGLAVAMYGCSSDKFDLESVTSSTGSSAGGGGVGGEGSGAGGSSSSGNNGGAGGGFVEPAGATTVTLVNGVVDYDAMRFCLLPYPAGAGSEQPWPGAEGVPYAGAAIETDVEQLVTAGQDIEVVGFGGDLTAIANDSCAQILASPPEDVQIASFGILPASAFDQDRDLLLVPGGCMGGLGHSDVLQSLVCGASYTPQTPTPTMIAGFMSRLAEPNKVSMQFVQGSVALQPGALRVRPGEETGVAVLVDQNWAWGAIAPYPPFDNFSLSSLGTVGNARIELQQPNQMQLAANVPFASAFFNSNVLETEDMQDGQGYVFVAVGPSSGVAPGNWWNGFKVTVVSSNPAGI